MAFISLGLCKIGLHRWKYFANWIYGSYQGGRAAQHIVRHCSHCDKWQEYHGSYGDDWYEDISKPDYQLDVYE